MWYNFGLAKPWPGYALKDKYWRKLWGNSHKLEWLAVIPYAYKGKPLVDAAVKAIAQTSNYLHAMSCLFTNAAIQYNQRNLIAEITDREGRIWKWPCIHLQDNLTYGNTSPLTILLYALLQDLPWRINCCTFVKTHYYHISNFLLQLLHSTPKSWGFVKLHHILIMRERERKHPPLIA